MSNELRTRDGLPFNFVDGLRIKGVDVTNWEKIFIDQGASYVGFQPVGNLAATNVQAAIAELENEKQSKSEPITTAINLRPGANQGIVWDNDAFGGTQDTASITLETASGEATKMRFKMTNDSDDNFEFTAKTADGLTVFNNAMSLNGNVLLNAANYVDYTAPMISDYTALRAYAGSASQVRITANGLAGFFYYDATDTTSTDNGGTVIVSSNGCRWKRLFDAAVNVKWFGADNNGLVDSTRAIQSALDLGKDTVIPYGNYIVDPLTGVSPFSNQKITMENGAVLRCAPSSSSSVYSVIKVFEVSDVLIQGGTIVGDRADHIGSAGESGMGIYIANSSNVTVRNIETRDCWGDGIYVGGTGTTGVSSNVLIDNVISDNNRRQGLTIAAAVIVRVRGGRFINTNGTAPAAGIDIEPNPSKGVVTDVIVDGAQCAGNAGHGIAVSQTICNNVKLIRNTCYNNGLSGIQCAYVGSEVILSENTVTQNGEHGVSIFGDFAYITRDIKIHNNVVKNNGKTGIRFYENIMRFSVRGNTVYGNGHHGISFEGITSKCDDGVVTENICESNSQSATAIYDNIYIGSLCHLLQVSSNICRRGGLTNKPAYGVRVVTNEAHVIANNDLYLGGQTGNFVGTFSNVTIQKNIGFKTENRVLSASFPVDTADVLTITIPHGCAYTPSTHHCQLTIVRPSAFAMSEGYVVIQSVDAINVVARVSVTSAGPAGSVAYLALSIDRPPVL